MSDANKTFKIGLCMAGAISAGAYTAGVMDYLIEALDEWQKRKDNNEPGTPDHNIEIAIIGGASAGGMTGVIAASGIQDEISPVKKLEGDILSPIPSNKFYHSWVDLISDDMLSVLLNTSDISKNGLHSALNADFIDEIAERAISASGQEPITRKYIAEDLKVFVTLSNLQGMNFKVAFKANSTNNKYFVSNHNDYACFKLCKSDENYGKDGWIPLNFKTSLNTDVARDAAMATGAFPVGLKARKVSRGNTYMNDHGWFKYITEADNPFKDDTYNTVNVDGGMINNEPFDKIREFLSGNSGEEDDHLQDYNKFKSTILMIDPFPAEQDEFNNSTLLTTTMANTLGALMNQARVKSSVLIKAMDSKKAGQFLISPVRYEKNEAYEKTIEGKKAIACGSLGGFGGFISKEFRIHDYFLGRANCEKFLRDHFTVPSDTTNEIFVNGYSAIQDRTQFTSETDKGLQIIPLFSKQQDEVYMPVFSNNKKWPSVTYAEVNSYRGKIKERVHKILFNISKYSVKQRVLLWIGATFFLNGKLADTALNNMISSLEKHSLIHK